jgi:hypothetical protein
MPNFHGSRTYYGWGQRTQTCQQEKGGVSLVAFGSASKPCQVAPTWSNRPVLNEEILD